MKKAFTPSQALAYVIIEVGDILSKHRRGFNKPVNARLNKIMTTVLKSTPDEAFNAWFQCHGIRGYHGKMSVSEVLGPYLKLMREMLHHGKIPEGAKGVPIDWMLYEFDWWEPREITVTENLPDGSKRGTATVLEVEGLYKLQLNWVMDVGEEAQEAGLPAMLNITGASMRLPKNFTVFDAQDRPTDLLEVAQELDAIQGFSAAILSEIYEGDMPDE